jgi:hypothetical protein
VPESGHPTDEELRQGKASSEDDLIEQETPASSREKGNGRVGDVSRRADQDNVCHAVIFHGRMTAWWQRHDIGGF